MSPSSSRGKRPVHEKVERRIALRKFMEDAIEEKKALSLSIISKAFKFESNSYSESTINRDLAAIQCKNFGSGYTFFNTDEEKNRLILEQNLGLLAENVLYAGKRDICWLPIRTEPDQGEKVANALMQTYPDLIFGCIPSNTYVCAAFVSKQKKEIVQEHLKKLMKLPTEDVQSKNFPRIPLLMKRDLVEE